MGAIDKDSLKVAIKEVLVEDPAFLKSLILEILAEDKKESTIDQSFATALENVFAEHEETLKRLA